MIQGNKPDFKCVIVGEMGTGKTCLFNRICRGTFDENTQTTLDFCGVKSIPISVDGRDGPLIMSLWDTIGDDRFMSPTRQFTRNSNAALICCALNDTDFDAEKAKFWTHIFLKDSPTCKLYLVGTKCDLNKVKNNETQLEEYAEMYNGHYMETSAKENINVDKLMKLVASDFARSGLPKEDRFRGFHLDEAPPDDTTCFKKLSLWC